MRAGAERSPLVSIPLWSLPVLRSTSRHSPKATALSAL